MSLICKINSKVDNFSLDINFKTDSKKIGVLGASGAGKSMFLKYLAGIFTADSGYIALGDKIFFDSENKINVSPQKRNIAYMFQNYALFPNMSVKDNISIVMKEKKEEKNIKLDMLMKKLHIENLADKRPAELSGGQQQRVALARILAYNPDIILLDEPFSALDTNLKERLQLELEDMLADYDGTIIMVSHSKDELFRFSEELIIINDGAVLERGDTKKLFKKPSTFQGAKMLGISNIIEAKIDENFKLAIPSLDIENMVVDFVDNDISREEVSYVGIRDEDFEIILDKENIEIKETIIPIKIERIFEEVEKIKFFFSLCLPDNKEREVNFENLYSFKIANNKEYKEMILKSKVFLGLNKEKLIYIKK